MQHIFNMQEWSVLGKTNICFGISVKVLVLYLLKVQIENKEDAVKSTNLP